MLSMNRFGEKLELLGFNFYSGVPCSFLKPMINYSINKDQFVMAANEGDAVAIAAGATLGGAKSIFLCQNSGLTNAVSPLTSLNYTFEIPVLGFVSLRGEPGVADEPQHELMGTITDQLLTLMNVQNEILSTDEEEAIAQLERANKAIEAGQSFFFIVRKDTFSSIKLIQKEEKKQVQAVIKKSDSIPEKIKRIDVLDMLQQQSDANTVLLATTGVTGRELFELGHKDNQLYMVGSMGCISSLGLGLAHVKPNVNVIVIDGDGSLLMRMGSLATNAFYQPKNLYHLLLDNGIHESTGGQKTVSSNIDFMKIANGANYEFVEQINSIEELKNSITKWKSNQQLTFAYMRTEQGIKEDLGRPTLTPVQVKRDFIKYIQYKIN